MSKRSKKQTASIVFTNEKRGTGESKLAKIVGVVILSAVIAVTAAVGYVMMSGNENILLDNEKYTVVYELFGFNVNNMNEK